MQVREPDDLLKPISQSIMLKGLAIALAIHAVIILGTSFGLYKDWGTVRDPETGKRLGFLTRPTTIKAAKQTAKQMAEDAARKEATALKDAERAAAAKELEARKPASRTSRDDDLDGPDSIKVPDIEPLPPKNFDINDLGI